MSRSAFRTLRTTCLCTSQASRCPSARPWLASSPQTRSWTTSSRASASFTSLSKSPVEVIDDANSSETAQKKRPKRSETGKTSLRTVAVEAQMGRETKAMIRHGAGGQKTDSKTITAISLAEAFDMDSITSILRAYQYPIDPDGTGFDADQLIHTRGTNDGDLFIFPSGTLVTWSMPSNVAMELAKDVLMPATIGYNASKVEMEDLEYEEDPARAQSTVKGDLVILGTKKQARGDPTKTSSDKLGTTYAKIAFSSGLARSTKLAVLETMLSRYFEKTRHIPALLSEGLRLTIDREVILRRTGELLELRAQLNHYSELTDSLPDAFWDRSHKLGLEDYYEQIGRVLDVGIRIRTLNQKMDYAQEIATILRQYLSEKHGTKLEWIIILLIFVEVLFGMRGIYNEVQSRWEKEAAASSAEGARS